MKITNQNINAIATQEEEIFLFELNKCYQNLKKIDRDTHSLFELHKVYRKNLSDGLLQLEKGDINFSAQKWQHTVTKNREALYHKVQHTLFFLTFVEVNLEILRIKANINDPEMLEEATHLDTEFSYHYSKLDKRNLRGYPLLYLKKMKEKIRSTRKLELHDIRFHYISQCREPINEKLGFLFKKSKNLREDLTSYLFVEPKGSLK